MLLINILTILSINLLLALNIKIKNRIILVILLALGFITLNLIFKTFENSFIIYLVLLFSVGTIFAKLFEKYAPLNDKINGTEKFIKFRFIIFRIISPLLITIFQILLLSDTNIQKDILKDSQQNSIKAVK